MINLYYWRTLNRVSLRRLSAQSGIDAAVALEGITEPNIKAMPCGPMNNKKTASLRLK